MRETKETVVKSQVLFKVGQIVAFRIGCAVYLRGEFEVVKVKRTGKKRKGRAQYVTIRLDHEDRPYHSSYLEIVEQSDTTQNGGVYGTDNVQR